MRHGPALAFTGERRRTGRTEIDMKTMNAQVKKSAPLKLMMLAALFSSRSQTVPVEQRKGWGAAAGHVYP